MIEYKKSWPDEPATGGNEAMSCFLGMAAVLAGFYLLAVVLFCF